jgi:cytochrome P450
MTEPAHPTSDAFTQNAHRAFAEMRAMPGLYSHGTPSGRTVYYVTRCDEAMLALKDPRLKMSFRNALTPEEIAATPPAPPFFELLLRNVLNQDPPDHGRMRAIVSKAFTPRRIQALRPRIQVVADELIDAMQVNEEADLIDAFAFPLPIIVICEMLGVPVDDRDLFRAWSAVLLQASDLDLNADKLGLIAKAVLEFEAYARALIEARRASPGEDLVTALIRVEADGDRLDEIELLSMLLLLIVAGHETTVNLIGNGMLALLQHPDALTALQEDASRIPDAIEEMLRYDGPVETSSRRWVSEDMELGGEQLRRGDIVLVSVLAANRDPAKFPDAESFDIQRSGARHVAFGHGIHYCLGAPLARLEGQIAVATLLRRLPDLRLAEPADTLRWRPGNLLHGLERLPVAWGPPARG